MVILTQLYLLSLFDSLCFGLTVPLLPPFILSLGGNHFILGVLASLHNSLQLISEPLNRSLTVHFGKRLTLIITLTVALVSNIGLCFAGFPWLVVVIRSIFSLTNQTQALTKNFLLENIPKEHHEGAYSLMGIFGVVGFVIGPIITGHLLDIRHGVVYVCLIASTMTILSIALANNLQETNAKKTKPIKQNWMNEFYKNSVSDTTTFIENLKKSNWEKHQVVLLMKFLYSSVLAIFFTKFVVLLKTHFNASATIIGYIIAYQSILLFCSNFAAPVIKHKFYKNDLNCLNRLVQGCTLLGVSLVGLCFAPTYDVYLLSVIPLSVSRTLLDETWKEFFGKRTKEEKSLENAVKATNLVASLLVPVLFGVFCDLCGTFAIKTCTILPVILIVYLVTKHKETVSEDQKQKQKNK